MGAVCRSTNKKRQSLNDIKFGQQLLVFKVHISGIKAKNLQLNGSYITIKVCEQQCKTHMIRYTRFPHWNNVFQFDVTVGSSQVDTAFFLLQIFDENDKPHYKLKYSIGQIATDPIHHDIQFSSKESIIFDLKVAQNIQYKIITKFLHVNFQSKLQELGYSFKYKIKSQDLEKYSELSQTYINPMYAVQPEEAEEYSPDKFTVQKPSGASSKHVSNRHISTLHVLQGQKEVNWEFKFEDAPKIEFDIFANDFATTTFIVLLYSKVSHRSDEYKRLGLSYLSFNKFCNDNVSTIAQTDRLIIQESTIKSKITCDGSFIGHLKGQFIIQSNQYFQQLSGVRTQDGIVHQSALLLRKAKIMSQDNKEIDRLIDLQVKLENLGQIVRDKKVRETEKAKNEILAALADSESQRLKLYHGEEEILHCQQILLKLMKYLLENGDKQTECVKELFYSVLCQLIFREEMHQDYLCIDQRDERLHVAQQYIQLILKTIPVAINKILDYSCSDKEHQFFAKFAVLAYFMLPQFRYVLFSIAKPQIQHKLYEWVFSNERGSQLQKEVEQLAIEIPNEEYHLFLYPFVCQFVEQIQRKNQDKTLWESEVGYEQVVERLMKYIKPKNEMFIKASCMLIYNPMLLTRFIGRTFSQTRVYDAYEVFGTFKLTDIWLEATSKKFQKLPTNFDYGFFFKGIYMVLESEHSIAISKCLQVLYNHFHLLPSDPKKELCDYLFGETFFKLFLHWSPIVRLCFMQLLVYRIQHRHRALKSKYQRIIEINQELIYALKTVYPQQEKNKLINDMIYLKYSHLIQIVKKINQKLLNSETRYEQQLRKLLQDKSLKLRLFKKKQKELNMHRSDSKKSDYPDFLFDSQVSHVLSAQHVQDLRDNSIGSSEIDDSQTANQAWMGDVSLNMVQSSSFIDLKDIIKEVEVENDIKQQKLKRRISSELANKLKSFDQDEKNDSPTRIHTGKVMDFECKPNLLNTGVLKYLTQAYQEWQKIQKDYQLWLHKARLKNPADKDLQDKLMEYQVPVLNVNIPKDESSQEAYQHEEY